MVILDPDFIYVVAMYSKISTAISIVFGGSVNLWSFPENSGYFWIKSVLVLIRTFSSMLLSVSVAEHYLVPHIISAICPEE